MWERVFLDTWKSLPIPWRWKAAKVKGYTSERPVEWDRQALQSDRQLYMCEYKNVKGSLSVSREGWMCLGLYYTRTQTRVGDRISGWIWPWTRPSRILRSLRNPNIILFNQLSITVIITILVVLKIMFFNG